MRIGHRMKSILEIMKKENVPLERLEEIISKIQGMPRNQKERDLLYATYSRSRRNLRKYDLIEERKFRILYNQEGYERELCIWVNGEMLKNSKPTVENLLHRANVMPEHWYLRRYGVIKMEEVTEIKEAKGKYPNIEWIPLFLKKEK